MLTGRGDIGQALSRDAAPPPQSAVTAVRTHPREIVMMKPALLAAALLAASVAAAPAQEARTPRLSVTGAGTVTATPDMAVLQIAVSARREDAAGAFAAAAEAARAVFAAVAAAGVAEADLRTTGLSLGPVYAGGGDEPLRIEAYQARQGLGVAVRDLGRLGALMDAVTATGAVEIEGIGFEIADRTALRDEARRRAVADAQRAAALLAEAAGVALGPITALALREDYGDPRPMMRAAAMDSMPVAAGSLTVTATVNAEFALE